MLSYTCFEQTVHHQEVTSVQAAYSIFMLKLCSKLWGSVGLTGCNVFCTSRISWYMRLCSPHTGEHNPIYEQSP